MTIAFDHRSLRPLDAALLALRGMRLRIQGSRAFVALIGSVVVTACTATILGARLTAATDDARAELVRLAQSEVQAAPAKSIVHRIDEIRGIAAELSQAEHSGDRAADELARLGNAVPAHVWIARFRRDGRALVFDGGARSVDAVGRALESFHSVGTAAQLVGLKDAARPGEAAEIRYSVRLETP